MQAGLVESALWQDVLNLCKRTREVMRELHGSGLDPARQKLCAQLDGMAEGVEYRMSEEITQKTEALR